MHGPSRDFRDAALPLRQLAHRRRSQETVERPGGRPHQPDSPREVWDAARHALSGWRVDARKRQPRPRRSAPARKSGRDFHGCVEVHLTCGAPWPDGPMPWARHSQPVLVHPTNMELDCPLDSPERGIDSLPGRDATRQIRHRGSPVAVRILVDANEILQLSHVLPRLRPACRIAEASVPLGMSSPRWPHTVTRPGLAGCLDCRWLPSVMTKRHPSASSRRITSRTFTGTAYQASRNLARQAGSARACRYCLTTASADPRRTACSLSPVPSDRPTRCACPPGTRRSHPGRTARGPERPRR